MKPLSHLALNIRPSTTLAIDAMFKQMKAEGQDMPVFLLLRLQLQWLLMLEPALPGRSPWRLDLLRVNLVYVPLLFPTCSVMRPLSCGKDLHWRLFRSLSAL